MKLFDELKWRGLINDMSSPDLEEKLNKGGLTFYIGVDPTGDSLHIGHYCSVITMTKRLMDGGHNPIIIAGGGTGLIGDPKLSSERPMIAKESAAKNTECIKRQIDSLLKTDVTVINNLDWLLNINCIDFLRDYGKFFNVNYMLSKETVKRRLDIGITYAEFSYMILQSIDFLKLYEMHNCVMQIGGQDQWGNITAGLELIRKVHGADTECYAMTMPLVTRADGSKFGKTENGESIWLDKEQTSPYEMYQFLINTADSKVIEYLKMLSFVTVDDIKNLETSLKNEPEKRLAQKALAYDVVKFIHGDKEAENARKISEEVFTKGYSDMGMPEITIKENELGSVLDLIVYTKIAVSKSDAKRLVEQNGISINNEKINDSNMIIDKSLFNDGFLVLSKGKKIHMKVSLK